MLDLNSIGSAKKATAPTKILTPILASTVDLKYPLPPASPKIHAIIKTANNAIDMIG